MAYTYSAPVETAYAIQTSYVLTKTFETGVEIYEDLEPFVKQAQSLLDDESI